MTVRTLEVTADDGRTLVAHDSGAPDAPGGRAAGAHAPVVVWHHGSPSTGALLPPVLDAARARGVRLVSYARPGYVGSTRAPGRDVAAGARDTARVLDALGIDRAAAVGYSGGGPHALASAALLGDRVTAVATFAGIAPLPAGRGDREDGWWWSGMAAPGGLRAATGGTGAREAFALTDEFDPAVFVDTDWAALAGPWGALGTDGDAAGEGVVGGPRGLVDDDVAFVHPWGFDLAQVGAPVLLVQGGADRVVPAEHARRQLDALPAAELWLRPRDGHVAVLDALDVALAWLRSSPLT